MVSPSTRTNKIVGSGWPGREEGLTAREAEVLSLITSGLSNADIAVRMSLSPNSIKSYVRSGYRKIDVTTRSQAVLWGISHGMGTAQPQQARPPGGSRPDVRQADAHQDLVAELTTSATGPARVHLDVRCSSKVDRSRSREEDRHPYHRDARRGPLRHA